MAAHPFGPIEKSLIVGYYKKEAILNIKNLKPVFGSGKTVAKLSQEKHLHSFLKPFYFGWSPANGNISTNRFRVSCVNNYESSQVNLLSRGLGYRITFTMKDKRIAEEFRNTWPDVEIMLTDLFGKDLEEVVFDADSWHRVFKRDPDPLLITYLNQFKKLQILLTLDSVNLIENGSIEAVFPTLDQEFGSPLSQVLQAAAAKHKKLLGGKFTEHISSFIGYKAFAETTLGGFIRCFNRPNNSFNAAELSQLRMHLNHFLAHFTSFWEPIVKKFESSDKKQIFEKLKNDVETWVRSENLFSPSLLNDRFFSDLNALQSNTAKSDSEQSWTEDPKMKRLFYYKLAYHAASPLSVFSQFIKQSTTVTKINEASNPDQVYSTKSFSVIHSNPLTFFKRGSAENSLVFELQLKTEPADPWRQLPFHVIPRTD